MTMDPRPSTAILRRQAPPGAWRDPWILRLADLTVFACVHTLLLVGRVGSWQTLVVDWPVQCGIAAICGGSVWLLDGWRIDPREPAWRLPLRFTAGISLGAIIIGLGVYLLGPELIGEAYGAAGRLVLAGSMLTTLGIGVLLRWHSVRRAKRRSSTSRWLLISTADDDLASRLAADATREPGMGSFVLARPGQDPMPTIDATWAGVVVHGILPHHALLAVMHARLGGLPVLDLPDFYERYWQRVPVVALDHRWFAVSDGFDLLHSHGYAHIKRAADVILAALVLLMAAPVMAAAAIAVRLDSCGPILYRQTRTGMGGRTFTIAKFRSMRTDAEAGGAKWAMANDPRVTRIGRFLRRSRVDELPQLWNVLRGDMSMIGPRPERPEFNQQLEQQIPWYDLRHLVKPGLSGWAQVNYPYGASVEDALRKLEFDLYYIKNQSFVLDTIIVLRTIRVVLRGFGSR